MSCDEAVVDLSQRAQAARVVGVIPKPFHIDQVVAAVHNAIDELVRPVTDAEELAHHDELIDKLRSAGAKDLATSTIGRSWVTFTTGRPPRTFNIYRWRAGGAYFIGRYRAGGAQMEPLGQFTDLGALIAYCSEQIRGLTSTTLCAVPQHRRPCEYYRVSPARAGLRRLWLRSRREAAMARTIAFLCDAPTHREVKLTRGSQNLTIHEGKWAVCPSASPDGHQWKEVVDGLNYDDLFEKHVVEKHRGS